MAGVAPVSVRPIDRRVVHALALALEYTTLDDVIAVCHTGRTGNAAVSQNSLWRCVMQTWLGLDSACGLAPAECGSTNVHSWREFARTVVGSGTVLRHIANLRQSDPPCLRIHSHLKALTPALYDDSVTPELELRERQLLRGRWVPLSDGLRWMAPLIECGAAVAGSGIVSPSQAPVAAITLVLLDTTRDAAAAAEAVLREAIPQMSFTGCVERLVRAVEAMHSPSQIAFVLDVFPLASQGQRTLITVVMPPPARVDAPAAGSVTPADGRSVADGDAAHITPPIGFSDVVTVTRPLTAAGATDAPRAAAATVAAQRRRQMDMYCATVTGLVEHSSVVALCFKAPDAPASESALGRWSARVGAGAWHTRAPLWQAAETSPTLVIFPHAGAGGAPRDVRIYALTSANAEVRRLVGSQLGPGETSPVADLIARCRAVLVPASRPRVATPDSDAAPLARTVRTPWSFGCGTLDEACYVEAHVPSTNAANSASTRDGAPQSPWRLRDDHETLLTIGHPVTFWQWPLLVQASIDRFLRTVETTVEDDDVVDRDDDHRTAEEQYQQQNGLYGPALASDLVAPQLAAIAAAYASVAQAEINETAAAPEGDCLALRGDAFAQEALAALCDAGERASSRASSAHGAADDEERERELLLMLAEDDDDEEAALLLSQLHARSGLPDRASAVPAATVAGAEADTHTAAGLLSRLFPTALLPRLAAMSRSDSSNSLSSVGAADDEMRLERVEGPWRPPAPLAGLATDAALDDPPSPDVSASGPGGDAPAATAATAVPVDIAEFNAIHLRHATAALLQAMHATRPYCTPHNAARALRPFRDQLDAYRRASRAALRGTSERYCQAVAAAVMAPVEAQYSRPRTLHRQRKDALRRWYRTVHEKIEEYLLKARGPARVSALSAFVQSRIIEPFVQATEVEAEGALLRFPASASVASSTPSDSLSGYPRALHVACIRLEDARLAADQLSREVEGMVRRVALRNADGDDIAFSSGVARTVARAPVDVAWRSAAVAVAARDLFAVHDHATTEQPAETPRENRTARAAVPLDVARSLDPLRVDFAPSVIRELRGVHAARMLQSAQRIIGPFRGTAPPRLAARAAGALLHQQRQILSTSSTSPSRTSSAAVPPRTSERDESRPVRVCPARWRTIVRDLLRQAAVSVMAAVATVVVAWVVQAGSRHAAAELRGSRPLE